MFSMKNYEENDLESKSNPSKTQFIENIIHNLVELLIIFYGSPRTLGACDDCVRSSAVMRTPAQPAEAKGVVGFVSGRLSLSPD